MPTSPDSEDTGRFRRRITTVPTVLAVAALGLLSAPFAVHLIALADLARGRLQLPGLRVWAMAMQYLFNETVEVLAAPLLWIAAGLGTRLDSPSSRRRHTRLALWSARSLARRAEQLLGVHLVVHEDRQRLPVNASTLVLARHASVLDAALPAVVLFDSNRVQDHTLTGVLMSELLSDPGFDLIYHRLGCVFVDRADGPDARRRIRRWPSPWAMLLWPWCFQKGGCSPGPPWTGGCRRSPSATRSGPGAWSPSTRSCRHIPVVCSRPSTGPTAHMSRWWRIGASRASRR
ncbi:MAG: hypothetical protein GY812_04580 [Actinomycetia bacterium]|nr:hypothetical protein [Actinomycetes bacterium]